MSYELFCMIFVDNFFKSEIHFLGIEEFSSFEISISPESSPLFFYFNFKKKEEIDQKYLIGYENINVDQVEIDEKI